MTTQFFDGFLDDYFAECDEHLTGARHALLSLEAGLGDPARERAAIGDLFRFFHSLKGISAMVELRPAEQLAHHLEHYLRAVRQREIRVTAEGIDLLMDGTERLAAVINAHRFSRPQPAIDDVIARVDQLGTADGAAVAGRPAGPPADGAQWKCVFAPTHDLLARGVGVDAVRRRLSEIGTIVNAAPQVRPDGSIAFEFTLTSDASPGAFDDLRADGVVAEPAEVLVDADADADADILLPGARRVAGAAGVSPSHVVRVDLTRLDELMRSVGDLVISRARMTDSLARIEHHVPNVEWRVVQDSAAAIDTQLRALREGIMRVRLVPVGEIFRRMPFVVRDLARETGKKVRLDIHGQDTEIDKYLIERMMDPVLHLVRNAISHGLELPDERIAAGKRPDGTITLNASAAGELVTIEVGDDGRGIDREAVAERARAVGLPVPAGEPDASTLLAWLCAPGFSTRDETDRASGRGVGMAVVKDTVDQLSGTLSLETRPGAGTRFLIQLPLTLAITDAIIARVGDEWFAVPQAAVREVIEVGAGEVRMVEQNEVIPYRGGALPIVRLARLFAIAPREAARFHLFVIGTGAAAVGLAADRIVGQREIVVRAITDPLVRVEGISGATDLGDGRVVLILDPATLARVTRQRASRALGAAGGWGRVQA